MLYFKAPRQTLWFPLLSSSLYHFSMWELDFHLSLNYLDFSKPLLPCKIYYIIDNSKTCKIHYHFEAPSFLMNLAATTSVLCEVPSVVPALPHCFPVPAIYGVLSCSHLRVPMVDALSIGD